MTISKGQPWGRATPRQAPSIIVDSDHSLAEQVSLALAINNMARIGLTGGDLCRTIAGPGSTTKIASTEAMTLPIDAISVMYDGHTGLAVAHVVARRRWWSGPILVVMNAEFLGPWDVATKGHPNDGFADVIEANLPFVERLKASRRLPLGAHVPHPHITQRRQKSGQFSFTKPARIFIDGHFVGTSMTLEFVVRPDAFEVVI